MTPVTECIRMSNHSFQPRTYSVVSSEDSIPNQQRASHVLPPLPSDEILSKRRGKGGVCGLMWAYSGGPWHERVGEPPAATSCESEYREEKWMGETNGEYFSEHRWQSALREMAQGDERGWGRWERRVVAFQRWRGVGGLVGGGSREGTVTAQAAPSHTCRAWQRFWPGCRVTVVTVTSQRGRVGPVSRSSHTLFASVRRPTTSRRIRQRSYISWEKNSREREREKIEQSQAGTKKQLFLVPQKKPQKTVRVKPSRYNQPVSICYLPWLKLTRVLSAHWSWSLSNNMKTLCFLESRVLKVLLVRTQLLEKYWPQTSSQMESEFVKSLCKRYDNNRKEADCAGGI